MALKLYRRHRKDCEGKHPEDTRTGEFEEGRRGWKKCRCQIHLAGTLQGRFNRKATGESEWESAKAFAAHLVANGSWDAEAPPARVPPTPSVPAPRVTIARACEAFVTELAETAAFSTLKKYKLFLKQLQAFSDKKGYVVLEQWQPIDVREFRTTWNVSPQTAARRMSILKPFFE